MLTAQKKTHTAPLSKDGYMHITEGVACLTGILHFFVRSLLGLTKCTYVQENSLLVELVK